VLSHTIALYFTLLLSLAAQLRLPWAHIITWLAETPWSEELIHLNLRVHVDLSQTLLALGVVPQPGHVLVIAKRVDQLHERVVG